MLSSNSNEANYQYRTRVMKDKKIDVSIIIVNYNLTESIRKLLLSIKNHVTGIKYEVIVVDNNSPDRSIENLKEEFPEFSFEFLSTNYGFGQGNNTGVKLSTGKYILLLNPDTYLIENLPLKLYQVAEDNPEFGVIGPQLIFPDGKYQVSYARFPNIKQELLVAVGLIGPALTLVYKMKDFFFRNIKSYSVDFVFGSCMFIARDLYEKVNGFDEEYFLISEETDLCFKIKSNLGKKIIYWKGTKLVHEKSLATGKNIPERMKQAYKSKLIFFNKHYSRFYVYALKFVIILSFLFKQLFVFRKGANKRLYREAYREIIRHYSS